MMTLRPHTCDLTRAKGKVPTPRGDVEVSWNWAGDKISLNVTISTGTEGEVVFPVKTYQTSAGKNHFESAGARASNNSL